MTTTGPDYIRTQLAAARVEMGALDAQVADARNALQHLENQQALWKTKVTTYEEVLAHMPETSATPLPAPVPVRAPKTDLQGIILKHLEDGAADLDTLVALVITDAPACPRRQIERSLSGLMDRKKVTVNGERKYCRPTARPTPPAAEE